LGSDENGRIATLPGIDPPTDPEAAMLRRLPFLQYRQS
jgi:hypothetical protein